METGATGAEPTLRSMAETVRAPVDVFEKARTHERKQLLELAREGDLLLYFRVMTSAVGGSIFSTSDDSPVLSLLPVQPARSVMAMRKWATRIIETSVWQISLRVVPSIVRKLRRCRGRVPSFA